MPRMFFAAACMMFAMASDASDVVARIGTRQVLRSELSCHTTDVDRITAQSQRRAEDVCLEIEQRRLDRILSAALVEAAARRLSISVAADEAVARLAAGGMTKQTFEKQSSGMSVVPRAALRVARGESLHDVYVDMVAPEALEAAGIGNLRLSEEEFAKAVEILGAPSAIERFLAAST